jgi:hypothetical protein
MVLNKKKEEEEGAPNNEADLAPSHFLVERTSVHPPFLEVSTRHTSRDQMTQATKPSLDGFKLMNA